MVKPALIFPPRLKLNLLYPQGIRHKIYMRFLHWLISYGRFIVVGVEIIVVSMFILRFKMDASLADLKDNIRDQVPYLESLSQDEAIIKQTQLKLALIKKTYASSTLLGPALNKINSLVPQNVRFANLTVENIENTSLFQFKITAQSNATNSISAFLNNLKNDPGFKDISLVNISYDQGQVIFTITGTTKL